MALGIRQDLRQTQQLVMTPQLQQAIKLLQMSNLDLREFVEREMESNPLIQIGEGPEGTNAKHDTATGAQSEIRAENEETPLDARLTPEGDHSLSVETFDTGAENLYDTAPGPARGEVAEWAGIGAGRNSGGQSFGAMGNTQGFDLEQQPNRPETLRAHLLAQLGQCRAEPPVLLLARILVEELDEQGFLRIDLARLGARLGATAEQAAAALALVQDCEPTGVAAYDLAACLALQLAERDRLDPAMQQLIENLDLLQRGDLRRLRALCAVDEEDFRAMLAELRELDPRPGAGFQVERAETLIPDVFLRQAPGGGWEVELNTETLPRVLVDNRYAAQIAAAGAEARAFVSDCRAGANWLKRSLDQRARSILAVAAEIVRHQDLFFSNGVAGLKPLTLQMVAEAVGLHESTVSRVTSNKYIATGQGIFELKFFFTNAIGPDGLAAAAVRDKIRRLISAEEPGRILSDDTIVKQLQDDGVEIARRTVAKYRKSLGIASSVERRRMKAMISEI